MYGKKSWASVAKSNDSKSLADIIADEQVEKNRSEIERGQLQAVMEASLAQQQQEDDMIAQAIALSLREAPEESVNISDSNVTHQQENTATVALSSSENEEIQRALRLADNAQEEESFRLAVMLQSEEERLVQPTQHNPVGNVRVMTRQQVYLEEATASVVGPIQGHGHYYSAAAAADESEDGFRMNSNRPSTAWTRIDRSTIVGPNQELRTKHDVELNNQANAHRLGLLDTDIRLGNRAFNAFIEKQKKTTTKSGGGGIKRGGGSNPSAEPRIVSLSGTSTTSQDSSESVLRSSPSIARPCEVAETELNEEKEDEPKVNDEAVKDELLGAIKNDNLTD